MGEYQDYVIKDGKFLGRFEEMYQAFKDPWHQKETLDNSVSRWATILNVKKYGVKSLIECGCGLGHYTNMIYRETGIDILGIDIAETAITKAKESFPYLRFVVDSVLNLSRYTDFEAILFPEITWYILPHLNDLLEIMLKYFPGKYFLHNLVFYKERQEYGAEYFKTLEQFVRYIPFPLLGYSESTSKDSNVIETSTIFQIENRHTKGQIAHFLGLW